MKKLITWVKKYKVTCVSAIIFNNPNGLPCGHSPLGLSVSKSCKAIPKFCKDAQTV